MLSKIYPPKSCEICDTVFEKPHNVMAAAWEKRRFCSRACWGVYSGNAQRMPARNCLACGKEYHPLNFASKYCSPECGKHRFLHKQGDNHPNWKGGRVVHDGYIRVRVLPEHPMFESMGGKNDYIFEHRLVMSEILGRPMEEHETVHHKNGIRDDNRPENLELRSGRHGKGSTKHCPTCTCSEHKN